tara:strand:- start:1029 stop:2048 length:1020 start_codon:yes stop_codon:yes gene_type:complete
MKLVSVIKEDEDNNIEYLISKYVELANSGGSDKALQKWLSMITVRLASLGAGQGTIKKIVASVKGASDQKDVDKIIAMFDLFNDYPDTFVAEMSLSGALSASWGSIKSLYEDVEEDVRKYKVVLSIPFTTEKNRKDKIDELKFHFALKNIKIDKLTPVKVAEIGSGVLDYQVVAFINTTMSRNELEHELEPEYKINKMERLNPPKDDDGLDEAKRIPRKKGQHRQSSSHSDLYTDENPKGTIKGLKFATVKDAEASVRKIKGSGKSHAHKIQAAVAMEQRAREMGKKSAAGVYRSFINAMKKKTKKKNEGWSQKYKRSIDCNNPKGFSQKAHCAGRKKK